MRLLLPLVLAFAAACAPARETPDAGEAPSPPAQPAESAAAPIAELPSAAFDAGLSGIDSVVEACIARGDVPGAIVAVVRRNRVVFEKAYGLRTATPRPEPMTVDTVFDLASLTKPIATAASIFALADQHRLRLTDPVSRYLPALAGQEVGRVTLEELLLHTAGLPADNALGDYSRGREAALAAIARLPLDSSPGEAFEYSDIGYILLGDVIEHLSGQTLDAFSRERLFVPLGMRDTTFLPGPALLGRVAPTERRDGQLFPGEVHDPRARALGGIAGHAGLFSTARDLTTFARMLMHGGELDGARVLAAASVKAMTAPRDVPGGRRSLGWDVETSFSGARGTLPGGLGHTGFTGTSLWMVPSQGVAVVVLSARVHPDGRGSAVRLRREVASVVAGSLSAPSILSGIDMLERDGFAALQGRRIGLVTNRAAVDHAGRTTLDVLREASGVKLVALFAPEHGITAARDEAVADARDVASGLSVYSLYGAHLRPPDDELQGVDTLVYDLPDAGARFFTYTTTLGYLLETAAAHHLRIVVLDRPNPLGAARVEGPVLELGRESFTGYHPLPVRHGMTTGELASLFNEERKIFADLQVIRAAGLHREDDFESTGLKWVPPSPNLTTPEAALAYPGVALLETTNVSVGRGTERPFRRVGAPFIDGRELASSLAAAALPGVRFSPVQFTPSASRFAGVACAGIDLAVIDKERFEPVRTGLAIAGALAALYPRDWQSRNLLLLLGDEPTASAVLAGEPAARVLEVAGRGLGAFLDVRRRHLLY